MRRRGRVWGLVALVGAFMALGARAEAGEARVYPGERNADGMTWTFTKLATAFWRERGVNTEGLCPSGVTAMLASSLIDDDGGAAGRADRCRFWLLDFGGGERPTRAYLRYKCATVVHEVGHAYGIAVGTFHSGAATWDPYAQVWTGGEPLYENDRWVGEWRDNHPDHGVMSQGGRGSVPYACRKLARAIARQR